MKPLRRFILVLCLLPVSGLVIGCASVDPAGDHERVRQDVARATGQEMAPPTVDDGAILARVEAFMADGLTADEAVQVALLNNSGLQATWMDVGMARADFVQAGLLSNPSLGGALRFPSGGGLANLELGIAQNIAELWQIPTRRRTAQAAIEQAILRLAGRAANLAADSRTAYFRTVGDSELYQVARENLAITQQLLDLALGRQQAGAGSEIDVNLSRAAVLESESAVESARLTAAESRRALAGLLGLATDPELIILSESFPQAFNGSFQADRVVEYARQQRPDIRAAEQAVARAEAQLQQERLGLFSALELGVALERSERRTNDPPGEDSIIGPSWNLELPIFDENQAQIAKAGYACEQARHELTGIERRMTQEVRGAIDRMTTAWRVVSLYRDRFVPLAQGNLELARESYKAGRASFLSVLEAQRFHLETRRRTIEALQSAAVTIPELERVVSTPIGRLREVLGESATTWPAGRQGSSRPARGRP